MRALKQQLITAFFGGATPSSTAAHAGQPNNDACSHSTPPCCARPARCPEASAKPSEPPRQYCADDRPAAPLPPAVRAIPELLPLVPRNHPFLQLLTGGVMRTSRGGRGVARASTHCRQRASGPRANTRASRARHSSRGDVIARLRAEECTTDSVAPRHTPPAPAPAPAPTSAPVQTPERCVKRLVVDVGSQDDDSFLATNARPTALPAHVLTPPKEPPGQGDVLKRYGEWVPIEPLPADTDWLVEDYALRDYYVPYAIAEDKLKSELIGSGVSANVYCACAALKEQRKRSARLPREHESGVCVRDVRTDESEHRQDAAQASRTQADARKELVAIKVLKPKSPQQYFLNELRAFSLLTPHRDVVGFYGFTYDAERNARAIITEFCANGSLFDLMHGTGGVRTSRQHAATPCGLPPLAAALVAHREKLALQVARAVAHLHGHGLVQIDLTSRNVLVTAGFDAKLSDFGLATRLREGFGVRTPSHGPSYWRAPEIVRKSERATHGAHAYYTAAADVFSYAVVVWELFHLGQFPWAGAPNPCAKLLAGERPDIAPDVPEFWRGLIACCWAHDPFKRPAAQAIVDSVARARPHLQLL